MGKMAMLGVAVVNKDRKSGKSTLYAEYHQCDICGVEFRLYFKTDEALREALEIIKKRLGPEGREDTCYSCKNDVPADQLVLTF